MPLLALLLLPIFPVPVYILHIFFIILMYIALSTSFNIMAGYTGYVPFGHAAFFGLGAYTTAVMAFQFGVSIFLTLPLAGIISMLFAALIGYPTLRLRGVYFAIATLVFNFIVEFMIYNIPWTRGARGITLPLLPFSMRTNKIIFYYSMLTIAVATVYVAYKILNSKFGLALISIREDEDAAEALGVNTARYKFYAFLISAFLAGIPGGLYAGYMSYINPETVFTLYIALNLILMAILGGMGTLIGPIIGPIILVTISEYLRYTISSAWYITILGIILILIMRYLPEGIYSILVKKAPYIGKYIG
jgi:branched-chain amino acid transport system permease protein